MRWNMAKDARKSAAKAGQKRPAVIEPMEARVLMSADTAALLPAVRFGVSQPQQGISAAYAAGRLSLAVNLGA